MERKLNISGNCRGPPVGHIRTAVCARRSPDFASSDFVRNGRLREGRAVNARPGTHQQLW